MTSLFNIPFDAANSTILANHLLNYTVLHIGTIPHRICEVEFYYYSHEHPDNYVHCHPDQKIPYSWYFHKSSSSSSTYKGGTYKGLDIVLGNSGPPVKFGGFLLRSIYSPLENRYIEGPCNTVNYILKILGKDTIYSLTSGNILYLNFPLLSICDCSKFSLDIHPLLVGPRIGLSTKYPDYNLLPYRYVIGNIRKQKRSLQYYRL